jgi:type 1 glutamine amidotransferase
VWAEWRPPFAAHDVLLLNFNGGHLPDALHWPHALQASLEQYVEKGGGLVILHAANNSFPNWEAYQHMIGLGWRDKDFGPGLIVDPEEKVLVVPVGEGRDPGHGPDHDFVITTLATDHPITRGMPKRWLHPAEQLTHGQHGPAGDMTVLTYAYSKDTHENEVMDWVIPYGEGRVYVTMLGHLWKDETDVNLRCVGFQTMLIRGVEWAATGQAHYPIPDNFPTATRTELGDALE